MRLVIFTDLDGTLLDHDTYSYDPARPALDLLRARNIPLVLASSKTAAEIETLHSALDLGAAPAIVENGAGVYRPNAATAENATDYSRIRAALSALPASIREAYQGFGDMTPDQIAHITGLPLQDAKRAAQRDYSEPGLWRGTDQAKTEFLAALQEQGIAAREGGRFLTLSLGATKADRMDQIATELGAGTTVALGDAPNDREMLEQADHGVIIRNDHGPGLPLLPGEQSGHIIRTDETGPIGWNRAVLALVASLTDGEQRP